jgi:cytochrome P450
MKYAKYGEMTTTHLGSKTWVILNSSRVATEIYNRCGAITNERPHLPVVNGLVSREKRSVWLHTAQWSERRRIMHQLLSGSAMAKYAEYQELESTQMLAEYVYQPDKWWVHHGRYSNSVIHRIALGERIPCASQKLADIFRVVIEFVTQGPPMNTIDCFPALSKLPKSFQWWRRRAEILGQSTFDVYSAYWTPIKKSIMAGNATHCFARDVLVGEGAKFSGDEQDAMYLALQLVEAGSDTTRASLNIFVMAAITYPDIFQMARAEVDRVCGSNAERLPVFADELAMPYVNALIKELLRWRPLFIWTPEHSLTEDLEFEGYYFPRGTSFVLNHYALSTDPAAFEEPETLKPDRWLDGHERDILKGLWIFGGGRRVCVGYRLAQRSLFINVARLLYCYDFTAVSVPRFK